jgi:iron(III)-enterobactin esterase
MTASSDLSARLSRLLARMRAGADGVRSQAFGDLEFPTSLAERPLTVYLPPAYRPGDDVPLLLALDGQSLPQWRLPEVVEQLWKTGGAELPLVVAIPSSAARKEEYGVPGVPDFAGRGRLAAEFQGFLAGPLLAAVRERYGVGRRPARTGILGASLGGLSAFHAAWGRPDCFGVAGVFSGSLWWRSDDSDPAAQQASRITHRLVREGRAQAARARFWFQAGTEDETEDRDGNGVIDAIQDTTELIDELVTAGWKRDRDVTYRETSGGRHDEATWAQELPAFLRWAWPRG